MKVSTETKKRIKTIVSSLLASLGIVATVTALITFVFNKNLPQFFPQPTPAIYASPTSIAGQNPGVLVNCKPGETKSFKAITISKDMANGLIDGDAKAQVAFLNLARVTFSAYLNRVAGVVEVFAGTGPTSNMAYAGSLSSAVAETLHKADFIFQYAEFQTFFIFNEPLYSISFTVTFFDEGCQVTP